MSVYDPSALVEIKKAYFLGGVFSGGFFLFLKHVNYINSTYFITSVLLFRNVIKKKFGTVHFSLSLAL